MSDYCDWPEFFDDREVRARVEHKCCECRRAIAVGEQYRRCTGKWDGEINTYHQHIRCWTFARKLNLEIIGECAIPFGGVEEALSDPQSWLDVLDETTVAKLRREWEEIKAA